MAEPISKQLQNLCKDAVLHRNFFIICFLVISIAIVSVGIVWPRMYSASTTVFVEEENILGPLMQGAAVQTEVIDRARIAREMIYGRRMMTRLLKRRGFLVDEPDPVKQDREIDSIKSRTTISTVRNNLVQISYSDSDPKRAYEITAELADLFINESLDAKARESLSAFEFIDSQVNEYQTKMEESEGHLKAFREVNLIAGPGMIAEIGRRTAELEAQLQQINQELREERIRQTSLQKQLSGEAAAATQFTRTEMFRKRIGELQAELATLRLNYHETYPDIVQIKAQVEELRLSITQENLRRKQGAGTGDDQRGFIDESALANPAYQQLQQQLYAAKTQISTLEARIDQKEQILAAQQVKAKRVQEYEAKLAELTRDTVVNRDIYSDLVRRREQARVSMNLDREQKGLTLRIDEPAFLPHKPSGLRFLHFTIAGPLLGIVIPLLLLFLYRQLDPRIRAVSVLSNEGNFPVLGIIPHMASRRERRFAIAGVGGSLFILLAGLVTLGVLVYTRLQGGL
ncbi:hypothetical protein MNBD_GAMMA15-626 [hydrothermal vent metagenome]|uniref:Lipopolysaccharide biosynthesis chain length determinant protein n=1 Tax=hydrothermal vent metagenome TaxID=652676 RepID=A0A3B0YA01_9ZZZZ